MKIALLGDVSVEFFASDFRREGHDIFVPSGFGAWREAVLAENGALKTFAPDAALVVRDEPRDEDGAALAVLATFCPHVVDIDIASLEAETPGFRDERMKQAAAFPFSLAGLHAIEDEFRWACRASPKKVLAVDADNTLWEGIVSEDGPDAVRPRAAFQKGLLALREKGVPLVLLTKNDPPSNGKSAVERVFSCDDMPMSLEDFAVVRSNWSPKVANLRIAAAEMNLAEDAFVFVDDNPHERAEMESLGNGVAVVAAERDDWPEMSQLQLLRRLREYFFADAGLTKEDLARAKMYEDEAKRRAAAANAPSLDEYLKSLDLTVAPSLATQDDIPRLAQMAGRTNQFNATTIRRDEQNFQNLLADPSKRVFVFRAKDRHGEMGLVCYVVCNLETGRATDFVMSCRAMGRTLEDFAFNYVRDEMSAIGSPLKGIDFVPTPRNEPFNAFHKTIDVNCPRRTFFHS